MKFCCSSVLFLGRLFISAIFLISGIGKFLDYEGTVQFMASKGLQFIPVLLVCAALLEIVTSLALIFGIKVRWAAFALFLYLIPTTYFFHDFWNSGADQFQLQFIMFLKNLSIMGGLLYIMGAGAGNFAIDRCCSVNRREEFDNSVA